MFEQDQVVKTKVTRDKHVRSSGSDVKNGNSPQKRQAFYSFK